ncbi:MAG TPA: ABC transporter substrate-binding protein [Rugosimonospora sp.]|nr:ABC transporter substrate-binding protein [Rugosimonospora sp.]
MRDRFTIVVAVLCLALTGCGSALTPRQRADVLAGQGGGGGQGTGGADTTGATGTGATGTGSTGTAASGGGPGGGGTGGAAAPAQCKGTGGATDTGVTARSIRIANVSDVSGPVQGLFESAQQAVKAYASYVNSTGGVCGRTLDLTSLDSRTDSRGDQEATASACAQDFALVGSMSAYDQGGAATESGCGIPDLRAVTTTGQRQHTAQTYGVNSNNETYLSSAVPDYYRSRYPAAVSKAAFLYLNSDVTAQNEAAFVKGFTSRGFTFVYEQAIDVADFNYAPYVLQLKNKGVRYVQWLGSYQHAARLLDAMKQQGFQPDVFVMDPVAYDANFVQQAGASAEGVSVFINTALVEEGGNREMQLYRSWLARVAPGAVPDYFGLFAWGAAKLFTQLVAQIGGNLTRKALLAALAAVHGYTAGGLFAPQDVGGRRTAQCWAFIRLHNGRWTRESPSSGFRCGSLVNTGVGG